jgi:hypothetical protein
MRTERFELARQKWEWLRPMLLGILPRSIAESRLSALEEYSGPVLPFIREWAAASLQAYRQQITAAFDQYGSLVQGGVVLFCFAMAPDWSGPFMALIVVLLILIIRGAYMHGREGYRTDGITDAALTLLFLLAAEALTLQMAPSLSVPKDVFFKGAFTCLPLLAMFRMLSQPLPQPDPNTPLWPGMPPERIYWSTARLNVLWILMYYLIISMFVSDQPGSIVDSMRGLLPGLTFLVWISIQTDRLARRDNLQDLHTDPKLQKLGRLIQTLPQGMEKGEPLYWWYITLEAAIFGIGAANIGVELWWWLHGASQAGWYRIGAALLAFVVAVASWRYLKAANRAAAAAIQAAIDVSAPRGLA